MQLTVRSGTATGRQIDLAGHPIVLGRDEDCDLVLDDEKISRRHARFTLNADGTATIEDLGSTNGTFVEGQRVSAPVVLRGGEDLRLGDTRLALSSSETIASALPTTIAPIAEPTLPGASIPAASRPSSPSTIERIELRRSIKRSTVITVIAALGAVVALVVVVLFVTGVFGGDDAKPTATEIIGAVKPSTVQIRGIDADGTSFGLGTGWVYDAEKGLLVTNAHVVNAATKFTITLGDETRERPAEVVAVAQCDDLAVLRVKDTTGMKTLPLGSQEALAQGDPVVALGYPTSFAEGDPLITTEGVVSVVRAKTLRDLFDQQYPNVIQTDAVINPGNSGGPLVNADEELVGVNTLKTVQSGFEGQFYAIGVDRVKEVVPQLAEGKSMGWPGMAFEFLVDPDDLPSVGLPAENGVVVTGAVAGTNSAKNGWADGPFLVVGIEGRPMDGSKRTYCGVVGSYEQGETAVFTVYSPNASETQDVNVRFE